MKRKLSEIEKQQLEKDIERWQQEEAVCRLKCQASAVAFGLDAEAGGIFYDVVKSDDCCHYPDKVFLNWLGEMSTKYKITTDAAEILWHNIRSIMKEDDLLLDEEYPLIFTDWGDLDS